jgi:uncharacterized membrane protein YfcA
MIDRVAQTASARRASTLLVFSSGAAVGVLGGLIGLGGAEFRLPVLVTIFGFVALHAVILNKAMSLVVVATALPARLLGQPYSDVAAHWSIAVNLLAGSLLGAWLGASWATRMHSRTLYRVLAVLLVFIAIILVASHFGDYGTIDLPALLRVAAAAAGVGIGVVAALMGVASGELLIPTIVVLIAVDIKIAGSLSLLVSLPTMLVAFVRYSRDQSFHVLRDNTGFVLTMAVGSITGTLLGGLLLGVIPSQALIPALAVLLLISSIKVWRHQ